MSVLRITRTTVAAGVALILTGAVAACGSSDSGTASEQGGGLDVIRIAYTPVASAAPLALGVEKGIYEKHGIDLELVDSGDNSAAIAASVAAGKAESGLWTWASLAATAAAKVPVSAISPMDEGPQEGGADFAQIVALDDSGIEDLSDLKGEKLAVNSLGGLQEFIARESLATVGLDKDDVELVPIPIVNMTSALESGQVSAVSIAEPFLSQLKADGATVLADANLSVMPGLPYTCVIMSDETIAEDPDLVKRFQAALLESMEYATNHEDEVRKVIPEFTGIEPELVEQMTLPHWSGEMDVDKAQQVADRFYDQGLLEASVDISTVVHPLP